MREQGMTEAAEQLREALRTLVSKGNLQPGALVVLGCSTSEVAGGVIGKESSPALGAALAAAFREACAECALHGAVQCCEHLNRSLVIEREYAEMRDLEIVSAVPYPKAGGPCGAAMYRMLKDPVLVSSVKADAGIDVVDTLIGMQLKPVAVPVRAPFDKVGEAHLVMAYSRPRLIGGERARYTLDD